MAEFHELLCGLAEDTKDYWVSSTVPTLDRPTAVQFMREAVLAYHPVILTGLMDSWPARNKWSRGYLTSTLGNRTVNINLTPDGHGDCVKRLYRSSSGESHRSDPVEEDFFVYPAEHDMTMADFFDTLDNRERGVVPYLSQQNDNLRQHLPELLADIPKSLPLGDEVFKSDVEGELEAVNLWIGDERSVSSIHKDHFENMYAVVSGEKTFTLFPPTDVAYLGRYAREYRTLRYAVKTQSDSSNSKDEGVAEVEYSLDPPGSAVTASNSSSNSSLALELRADGCPTERLQWLPLDPDDPEVTAKYPLLGHARPLRCTVRAGEVLYIPAMWYHRVSQTCLTVAVNYWYDQRFDFRFVFYQSMSRLGQCAAAIEDSELPDQVADRELDS